MALTLLLVSPNATGQQPDAATSSGRTEAQATDPPATAAEETGSDTAVAEATTPTPPTTPNSDARAAEKPPVSPVYEQLGGRVEVVGPDTYILIDAEGNPQKILNFPYEKFLELMKRERGDDTREGSKPTHTLDRLDVEGILKPGYAQFTASMEITLHTAEPTEVPLWFSNSTLLRQPQAPARPDGRFLEFVPEKLGWVATFQGQPGEKVSIELEFMAPLQRDGDRSRLRLLPRRATVGELRLDSPATIEELVVPDEKLIVTTEKIGEQGGTRIVARGLGGEFNVSWEEQREEVAESASVLSSKGQIRSHIDGNYVRTTATLTVNSPGPMFDTFRVRLPEGDEYVGYEEVTSSGPGASERLISSVEETTDDARGRVYVVKLAKETKGPVVLRLTTTHPLDRNEQAESVVQRTVLEGFDVLGAVRQDGEIALAVADQLQMSLTPTDNLQQIDLSDLTSTSGGASRDEYTTAYSYYSQPYRLQLEVAKRQRRVDATAQYDMTIGQEEVLLDMTVDYHITGVNSRELPIGFPMGFDLGGVGTDDHPDRNQVSRERRSRGPCRCASGGGGWQQSPRLSLRQRDSSADADRAALAARARCGAAV